MANIIENKMVFEAEKVKLTSKLFKDFVICTAYLMSDGINRNGSEFTLESLKNSLDTFINKPVLANIWFKRGLKNEEAYIGGHDASILVDEKGEEYVSYKEGERPVGVITDLSNITIKKYKGRNFVVAKLFLWKQYNPELIKILARDKNKKVSVEIVATDVEDYEQEGRIIKRINKFNFLGVTILGHKEILGRVEAIEEGIEHSHLELNEESLENYVLAYNKAFKSKDKIFKEDRYFDKNFVNDLSLEDKRSIVLEELRDIKGKNEIILLNLYAPNNTQEITGKYILDNIIYSFEGRLNLDHTFECINEKFVNEEILTEYCSYLKTLNNKEKLSYNAVNLCDKIENYDVGQLIYKIFTYCNSKEIVKLFFGTIEKGWEENPFRLLRQPFATIQEEKIIFSKDDLKHLKKERLITLYEDIKDIDSFKEIQELVKELIEKYEIGESQKMEENKIENEVIEEAKNQVEENCGIPTIQENSEVVDGENCSKTEIEESCEGKETMTADENIEINPEKEEETAKMEEDVAEEGKDNEESEKTYSKEEYESLKAQYDCLVEKYKELEEDYKKSNEEKEVEINALKTEIDNIKFNTFMSKVEEELKESELSDKYKAEIRDAFLQHKFSTITEVQKEIAFMEKQNKKEAYTFSAPLTPKIGKKANENNVFQKLEESVKDNK